MGLAETAARVVYPRPRANSAVHTEVATDRDSRGQLVSQPAVETRYLVRSTTTALSRHPKGRGKGDGLAKEPYWTGFQGGQIPTKTLQRNNFPVEPPRGFEPRTYALRDCANAWIHPYDLLPINEFRDTE